MSKYKSFFSYIFYLSQALILLFTLTFLLLFVSDELIRKKEENIINYLKDDNSCLSRVQLKDKKTKVQFINQLQYNPTDLYSKFNFPNLLHWLLKLRSIELVENHRPPSTPFEIKKKYWFQVPPNTKKLRIYKFALKFTYEDYFRISTFETRDIFIPISFEIATLKSGEFQFVRCSISSSKNN